MRERSPEPRQPPHENAPPAEATPQGEREGPLTVERLRKDDGRSLIAYWHAAD
jgi:hypothetical protein